MVHLLRLGRMSEEPPFIFCGIDMFAPFCEKWLQRYKQHGALYNCHSSRAIQMEVPCSVSTDSSIMCLRRLIGHRGNACMISSENGSNFTGPFVELIQAFQEMNNSKTSNHLKEYGGEWINWKRNPPFASNIWEVWEQQIRGTRTILNIYFICLKPMEESNRIATADPAS